MPYKETTGSPISDKVVGIGEKLMADPKGETLTRGEKALEVTRDETLFLLSILAGRNITGDYLRQLTRGEKPRLAPARPAGNSYLYRVEHIVDVRFTKPHKKGSSI